MTYRPEHVTVTVDGVPIDFGLVAATAHWVTVAVVPRRHRWRASLKASGLSSAQIRAARRRC